MTENHADIYGKEILPGIRLMRDGIFLFNPDATGRNDCPYCESSNYQDHRDLVNDTGIIAYVNGKGIAIEVEGFTDTIIKAYYCPKCGRKLEAKP